eukprot:COSAG03_NODE_94_length_13170_cov_67.181470_5_plen_41_part_00
MIWLMIDGASRAHHRHNTDVSVRDYAKKKFADSGILSFWR